MPNKITYEIIEIGLWVLTILLLDALWVIKAIKTKNWMPFIEEDEYSLVRVVFIPVALTISIFGIAALIFKGLVYSIHYIITTTC